MEEKKDVLNDIKSFSNLKKFTLLSILGSIVLLFSPWFGAISPINFINLKDEIIDIVDLEMVPFALNLLFNLGYITIFFLLFTIFKIYKSSYRFASMLQFFNILILVLIVSSNIFYSINGKYESWIEDEIENHNDWDDLTFQEKDEMMEEIKDDIIDVFDDYDIEENMNIKDIFRFTPIFFTILFFTNWYLIGTLSRRKRLEIMK